jgi:hypothetical protein
MTNQKNIQSDGDVAGGNIDKSKTYIINTQPKSRLSGLIEQLKDQVGKDKDAAEFVERLRSWMIPKNTVLSRDLETKLKDSGQGHLLHDALEAKERFTKQLRRTAFNPALQEIYVQILGEIHTAFTYRIKPKISPLTERGVIEGEIANLGEKITLQISDAPADLGLGLIEIIGMLYYLTGNCYLEWTYNDPVSPSH